MNRQSVLAVTGLAISGVVAGCTADRASTPACHLMHEVVESSADYGATIETYRYENLSSEAQQVFDRAVTDGYYETTNQSLNAPEFRYWDTTAVYDVTYKNETHVLLTYTGEGCESE
ncbi:hypothetical protein [Halosolutus halophilus]|uniref:hypothetical protein n=1 Tax=Halosolutus halophilus TaxID=1552990 RepID=UPI002234F2F5|nr:hypothetical protein [Halosolutus halophilus]